MFITQHDIMLITSCFIITHCQVGLEHGLGPGLARDVCPTELMNLLQQDLAWEAARKGIPVGLD